MTKVINADNYCYSQYANDIHFKQLIFISNKTTSERDKSCLHYFNYHNHTLEVFVEDNVTLTLYYNSDLISQISEPKPFRISSTFNKVEFLDRYFDNIMQFNQWCFDNFLTHNISKKHIQLNRYYDALICHPLTGDLCLPPFLFAKRHPDLQLSTSLSEINNLEPMLIKVEKGQSVHFDKYLYQCQYSSELRLMDNHDER